MKNSRLLYFFLVLTLVVIATGCSKKVALILPDAPSNLQVGEVTSSSITMIWQDRSNNEDGFTVFRGISNSNITTSVGNVGTGVITFTDSNVDPATTYYYKVVAFNSTGKSSPTNTVSGTTKQLLAQVSGQIVVQNSLGVEGVLVTLGSNQTVTAADGSFTFADLTPDMYVLKAEGGREEHYLIDPMDLILSAGENNLGQISAYQMLGVGVIIQSTTNMQSLSVPLKKSLATNKQDLLQEMVRRDYSFQLTSFSLASFTNLTDEISMVILKWEDLSASQYQIYYLGTGGETAKLVWDSNYLADADDPDFDPTHPVAYLDLGYELANVISDAGEYQFQVVGYDDTGTLIAELPVVIVSLGMVLENYPTGLSRSNDQLSWTEVIGADGYNIAIYDQNDALQQTDWEVGTSTMIREYLISGEYYTWMVDGQAIDESGWPIEITRGISGFIW
ncbi:MAG: hypothetical protein KAX49_10340 [Halanaerobiales bacterium]|nr:hypothetical protein [Halanaerobiales bacterium]